RLQSRLHRFFDDRMDLAVFFRRPDDRHHTSDIAREPTLFGADIYQYSITFGDHALACLVMRKRAVRPAADDPEQGLRSLRHEVRTYLGSKFRLFHARLYQFEG